MLTNEQIYKNRDAEATSEVSVLLELKYFDEQFLYYGTAYAENGRVKYRIHDNAEAMYRFVTYSAEQNRYPTEIRTYVKMEKVPSGMERNVEEKIRLAFVEQLQKDYSPELFRLLERYGNIPANDDAFAMLEGLREALEYCYQEEQIVLFTGLVQEAFDEKILTNASRIKLQDWIDRRLAIIRECQTDTGRKRTFYGFMALEQDEWKLYANAEEINIRNKRYQKMTEGVLCTPVFSKVYWLDKVPQRSLKGWRDVFSAEIHEYMDDAYQNQVRMLHDIPGPIDRQRFGDDAQKVADRLTTLDERTLHYYENRWKLQ